MEPGRYVWSKCQRRHRRVTAKHIRDSRQTGGGVTDIPVEEISMLSSYGDPQFALFLAQQRQQALLAEVEHDRLVEEVKSARATIRKTRQARPHLSLQVAPALMLAALRRG